MANQQQGRDPSGNQNGSGQNNPNGGPQQKNAERSEGGTRSGDTKERRGFAAMDQQKQREIASMGGLAAHRSGNAHEFDSEEAREAGRKGGQASAQNRAENARDGNGGNGNNGNRTGNR